MSNFANKVRVLLLLGTCFALTLATDYSNPNDKYSPDSNVRAGHKISGKDFDVTEEYAQAVLTIPVILFVLGILSLLFLNLFLCCRRCFKCLRCDPNDHHGEKGHEGDSEAKRLTYVNHQKFMIFLIEMGLCVAVLLADCFCFYGQQYFKKGGENLNTAIGDLRAILQGGYDGAGAIGSNFVPKMLAAIASAQGTGTLGAKTGTCTSNAEHNGPATTTIDTAYNTMSAALGAVKVAMDSVRTILQPGIDNIATAETYVNDYLIKYSDIFVYIVFAISFISVLIFVLFRLCRSECGTKFAMFWGMVTFLILLLVCLPFMIFTSAIGDLCMDPSRNLVMQTPEVGRDLVRFYATCVGTDNVQAGFQDGINGINTMLAQLASGSTLDTYCATNGTPGAQGYLADFGKIGLGGIGVKSELTKMMTVAGCAKIQSIWFTLVNDALCTNFYGGIYSLWVSQFVTSFFLFFLIVVASISYHYFKESKVYIGHDGQVQTANPEPKTFHEYQEQQKLAADADGGDVGPSNEAL
jgi:hypothetical protein